MDYQKFVNNASFTIFVAVVLVLVTIVCIIFLKNGWKEAERLGVSKEELKKLLLIALESVWFHLSRLCLA